jgi:hypothetical protein
MLSELAESIREIISKIPGYISVISSEFQGSSRKTKIIISVCIGVVAIFLIGQMFRGPSKRITKKSLRLRSLTQKDINGDVWTLSLVSGQPTPKKAVDGSKPGAPITVTPDVKSTRNMLSIGIDAEGQGGEKYVAAAIKNGNWPAPPTFKVVNEAGKIIGEGRFKYG